MVLAGVAFVVGGLAGCVEELHQRDIQVILRPETMGKSAMLGSVEDTLEMAKKVQGTQPCIDFAHLHARTGNGSMNTYAEWVQLLEDYGRQLGPAALKQLHIHLSGIDYGEKGEKEHLPIQESDLDLKAILLALHQFECQGRILCESPVMEDDAIYIRDEWLQISGETLTSPA